MVFFANVGLGSQLVEWMGAPFVGLALRHGNGGGWEWRDKQELVPLGQER